MENPANKQNLAFCGNLGTTLLASAIGFASLNMPSIFTLSHPWEATIAILLGLFLLVDVWCFYQPNTFLIT